MNDSKKSDMARIQAARSLLEYGLRLTEVYDLSQRIDRLEELADGGNQ